MEQLIILVVLLVALSFSLDLQHDNFKVQAALKSNFTMHYGKIDDHKIERRAVSSST